ncbi:MAG: SiaB family protein kinase [Bacteroidales bacterium]
MTSPKKILYHQGLFSYETTGKLIEKLRDKRSDYKIKKAIFRKILTLMIEIVENNYKYVEEKFNNKIIDDLNIYPTFQITKVGSVCTLESGNPILEDDIDFLKNKIDHINSLQYEDLKELYKKTMVEGIYKNKKGAGLGIIKMARISKNIIEYKFEKIQNNIYYYTVKINIASN